MDLSIVIVNWNTKGLLRDCLESLEHHPCAYDTEIIVVDNASTDGSVEMVRQSFPGVRLIANPDNRGFAAANNQAFKVSTGKYVLMLNSDTLVHGEVLTDSVDYLESHSKVGMMGCKVLNSDGTTQMTCSRFPTFTNLLLQTLGANRLGGPFFGRYQMLNWDRDDEREVEVISGCYLLVRSRVIAQIGMLDEAFFCYGEETDWCRRCSDAGWQMKFAPIGEITHFGSGTTRKLNHERDLMLSEGTVRLHRKHKGPVSAALVWSLLLVFNSSRTLFWSLRSMLGTREEHRNRALHFKNVVRNFNRTWPSIAK